MYHKKMQPAVQENISASQKLPKADTSINKARQRRREIKKQLKIEEKLRDGDLVKCALCENKYYKNSQRAADEHRRLVHKELHRVG